MSSSFNEDGFGSSRHRSTPAGVPSGIWDAVDQLRETFEKGFSSGFGGMGGGMGGTRMGKGDVRAAVLALLAERPMHGYQIIQEIEERSNGSWKPSPGSVYPTLQLLADEGLISVEELNGKKTYSLTEAGRAETAAAGEKSAPWESSGGRERRDGWNTALPKSGAKLAQAAAQVGRSGSAEQVKQAVEVLDDARRKLYSILAQD